MNAKDLSARNSSGISIFAGQMTKRFIIFTAVLMLTSTLGHAQAKYEREYRITKDTIPEKALDFIHQLGILNDSTKVKWYKEVTLTGETLEAKYRKNGRKHSVEFTNRGDFSDVEVEIGKGRIPSATMKAIQVYLTDNFRKYRMEKIQRQWVGDEVDVISSLKSGVVEGSVVVNYELIIRGVTAEEKRYYELLFDAEGTLLKRIRIAVNTSDNLIY